MADPGARFPIVGRAVELAEVRALVEVARHGEGRALLIEGDAGMGKSRLIEEGLSAATHVGMTVLRGKADELDSRRPLHALAASLGIGPSAHEPRRQGIAAVLFGPSSEGDETEALLVDGIVGLIEDLCTQAPVALAVDDLQWADPLTLQILQRLGRMAHLPLLLLGAYRPSPRPPALSRLVRTLSFGGATVLALGPLEPRGVAELLSSVLGLAPGPALIAQAAALGGNPFYVIELVLALQATQALVTTATTADVDSPTTPPAFNLTVLLELGLLSTGAQEVLRAASMLGSRFKVHDLATVLGRSPVSLAPPLGEVVKANVLHDDGAELSFRHDLVREALYEDVPQSLRKSMHLDIAKRLLESGATPLDVAEHVVRGASPGDTVALEWLKRAADEATVRAPAIAVELLEEAVVLFGPDDPGRDGLLADWALALETLGRLREAEAACGELLTRRQPPATEAKLRLCLARLLIRRGRIRDALGEMARAEQVEGLSPTQRARVLASASVFPLSGFLDLDLAEALARRGRLLAEEHGADVAAANCAYTLAAAAFLRARFEESVDWAARARVAEDQAPSDRVAQGWRHLRHGVVLITSQALHALDRVDESQAALRSARRTALHWGGHSFAAHGQSLAVSHGYMLGAWDDAGTEFDALLDGCREPEERPPITAVAAGARALIAFHRRENRAVGAALAVAGSDAAAHFGHLVALARALVAEASDGAAAGMAVLSSAWDDATRAGVSSVLQHLAPDLVRLALLTGDAGRAAEACDRMDGIAFANPTAVTIRGIALRCRGLRDDDPTMLLDAATLLRASPRPLEHALACEDAADSLSRHGRLSDAIPLFDQALAGFRRLDAECDVTRVNRRMRLLGVRRDHRQARRRPRSGWDALTPSERAVLDLVAERMSNAEIAERLYLSVHTVKRHLANARVKLGGTSRAEIARGASGRQG